MPYNVTLEKLRQENKITKLTMLKSSWHDDLRSSEIYQLIGSVISMIMRTQVCN